MSDVLTQAIETAAQLIAGENQKPRQEDLDYARDILAASLPVILADPANKIEESAYRHENWCSFLRHNGCCGDHCDCNIADISRLVRAYAEGITQ